MLSIVGVTKAYGPQILFRKATFSISEQARVGLIGPNGAGKTTFFRLLTGEDHPDEGEIHFPREYTVGIMRQEWKPHEGDSVVEAALRGFPKWFEARARLGTLEKKLETASDDSLLHEYHEAQSEFTAVGGWSLEPRVKEILAGLGFHAAEMLGPASRLSGGWRIRCHLAGLLLQTPDLLLLDEPTNHLDVETVVWLENFLLNYPKAVMIISHDRRLIQRLSQDILEFAPPKLTFWPGTLADYERQKEDRTAHLQAEITNKEREIARMEEFVRRFRAKATKARQAQNRLKTSEHFAEEVEELRAAMPVVSRRPSRFTLKLKRRLPRTMLEIETGVFGYSQEKPLFNLARCTVESGKKIGIIGANGVGKTTFLKTCAGDLSLLGGKLRRAEGVSFGYFAQHRMEELPREGKTFDYLYGNTDGATITEVRTVAASLGLSANDLDKSLDVLSGGERARVSLSRILLAAPGLLLLDEPTNHLDMEACDALVRGLSDYEGTVLVVSHDRDFLDILVDHILEIAPGQAHLHHGNYTEWFERLKRVPQASLTSRKEVAKESDRKEQRRAEAEVRQEKSRIDRKRKAKIDAVEADIELIRKEKSELETKLCDPESPRLPEFASWVRRHREVTDKLERLETRWLELSDEASSGAA